ncbi:S-adenosyl-L-methionine-dependent methyltransferase [Nemania sp. FL0031]|nr:S-adenosyl-L-methionine-dependent methyltransferase [Nemania sp. FL0031]
MQGVKMSKPTRIAELSTRIAANTAEIDNFLAAQFLPAPSFEPDAPLGLFGPNTDSRILAARESVIQDTLELRDLLLGPREHLFSSQPNYHLSQLSIVRFGLARHVPLDGETTFAELATAAGLGESHVRKVIRHAITQHIFREPRPGVVAHSASSRLLAEDADVAAWVRWRTDDCWLAAYHTCEAISRWPGSGEPNETGFSLASQASLGMFDVLKADPERATRFAAGMRLYAARPDLDVHYLVDAWPWGELQDGATVIDVGGSHGEAAIALARAFPSLKLVVQDIDEPTVLEADSRKPADVAERVRYMTHDFFTEQPIRHADVYLYRACLHNWSDKYAVRILRALIPALKVGARVLLNDVVVPGPEDMSPGVASNVRSGDLNMMMLFNAGDREVSNWAHLFELASPGFEFKGAKQPPGSGLWVLEALWNGVERIE